MASDKKFVFYIADQMKLAGEIAFKPMMGEYLINCDGIYVAVVSDNQLFIKPTEAGKQFIGNVTEKSAYPGAKPSFFIQSEFFEDEKWLGSLVRLTKDELSASKKKAKKKTISKNSK